MADSNNQFFRNETPDDLLPDANADEVALGQQFVDTGPNSNQENELPEELLHLLDEENEMVVDPNFWEPVENANHDTAFERQILESEANSNQAIAADGEENVLSEEDESTPAPVETVEEEAAAVVSEPNPNVQEEAAPVVNEAMSSMQEEPAVVNEPKISVQEVGDVIIVSGPPPSKRARYYEDDYFAHKIPMSDENLMAIRNTLLNADHYMLVGKLLREIKKIFKKRINLNRKLIDVLITLISRQIKKNTMAIKRLVPEYCLMLPNEIFYPPSQVVNLMIEHVSPFRIPILLWQVFGKTKPDLSKQEKYEEELFKLNFPAPAMTQSLFGIGRDLVQEFVFSELMEECEAEEAPSEQTKQVVNKLKLLLCHLEDENDSFHLEIYHCRICGFETESETLISIHAQTLHFGENESLKCGMCPESNADSVQMRRHYLKAHRLKPIIPKKLPVKFQCVCCALDFELESERDDHMKSCGNDMMRLAFLQRPQIPNDYAMVNQLLWPRPSVDPTLQALRVAQKTNKPIIILQ